MAPEVQAMRQKLIVFTDLMNFFFSLANKRYLNGYQAPIHNLASNCQIFYCGAKLSEDSILNSSRGNAFKKSPETSIKRRRL